MVLLHALEAKASSNPKGKKYNSSETNWKRGRIVPAAFTYLEPAISVPKAVVPEQLRVRDDEYYNTLNTSLVAPSQDEIEEQQTFLATIYKVIEAKLGEEDGIFLAEDAESSEQKWSPLAPKADIPSADIIDQNWAQEHTHAEFLHEQARLNNYAAANWRVFWTANPPDRHSAPEYYAQWNKLDDYCHQATQTWYNICFKELKEDTAEALDLDPIMLKSVKTGT
ncbi:hypothetical protein AX15_007197, partial [Amanita polypyramis BW_CC]